MIILPKEGECWEGKAVGEHLREEGGGERQKERWGEEEEREPWQDDMHAEKEEEKGSEDGVGGWGVKVVCVRSGDAGRKEQRGR